MYNIYEILLGTDLQNMKMFIKITKTFLVKLLFRCFVLVLKIRSLVIGNTGPQLSHLSQWQWSRLDYYYYY